MKNIKFRGKNAHTNKWVYGDYISPVVIPGYGQIIDNGYSYSVQEDTVGQYIGASDKYGKGLYEGDIIKIDEIEALAVVHYNEAYYAFVLAECTGGFLQFGEDVDPSDCKVIGNIWDNPELLTHNS